MKKQKRGKSKSKWDKYFLLNWRKLWIIIVAWFVAVLLHNLVSALLNLEEAFFFIIAVFVMPLYFIVTLIYSLVKIIKRGSR